MIKKLGKWLKRYFIPHEDNDHQPHILRWRSFLIILGIVLFSEIFFLAQAALIFRSSNFLASVLPNAIIELANGDRKGGNISELKVNPKLQSAAQLKANDMAEKGYFSHTSPEGITPWYWFEKAGYAWSYAGENLAINFFDSSDVNSAWMASPSHKENIMNMRFTEIGVGIAKGMYKGRESIFIVQLFGRPSSTGASLNKPAISKQAPNIVSAAGNNETGNDIAAGTTPIPQAVAGAGDETKETAQNPKKESSLETSPGHNLSNGLNPSLAENSRPAERLPGAKILLSMPRLLTNYIFIFLLAVIFTALVLKILIKIKIQYPALIANGILLLAIISLAILFNKYIVVASAMIF